MSAADVEKVIREEFTKAGVDPDLGVAIGKHESNLNPDAEALTGGDGLRGGSYGAMQMSMMTARGLGFQGTASDLKDPRTNAALAAKHVAELARRFRDPRDLAAAYNSGLPYDYAPDTTRKNYVPGVMKHLASGLEAPTAATEELGPVEPATPDDLGPVEPAAPPAATAPPAPPPDSTLTAFQATHSGVNGDQAAQALKLAKATGFAPEMVAQNLDTVQQRVDQTGFEDGLGAAPVLADYAARGPIEASLVKDDVPALSALNAGFLDLGRQYLTRKYMGMEPGAERDVIRGQIRNVERVQGQYEATDPGIVAQTARMLPTVASYILSGVGGAVAAGPAAPGGAIAGPFMLNYQTHVGELYMRLQDAEEAHAAADPAYVPRSDNEIREYAKKGAILSSTLLTSLGQPFLRGLPFATAALEKVGLGIVAKAGEESVVKAAVNRLLEVGAHTLSGAMTMAGMAVGDDATVQKATTGKIDVGQATKAGTKAFMDVLGPTAALSALTPVAHFWTDVGRIQDARMEAVDLAAKVAQAKSSKLVQRAPEQAEKLFRVMADGSGSETAYVAEFDRLPPDVAHAVARAAGPHSVGDDQATGGGVAVPIEKYLTQLKDTHESIKDNVRLSEDGLTPKEAAETQPDTLGALMAAKDWITRSEPDTPERATKIDDLMNRMRGVASRGDRGERPGLGRAATEEEVAAEMKKLETATPPGQEPTLAQTSPYEVPKPPKVTADDYSAAREHIEGKTLGEIRSSYYETAARRAGERALKLATGPDKVGEKIHEKYAEALGISLDTVRNAVQSVFRSGADVGKVGLDTKGEAILKKYAEALNVSLDTVRNAVQGAFSTGADVGKLGPDTKGEAILKKYAEALNVSIDTVRNAVQGTFKADSLAEVRRTVRGAETEANRLESGRMKELSRLEDEYAQHLRERQAKIESQQGALALARKSLLGAETEANKIESGRMQELRGLEAEYEQHLKERQGKIESQQNALAVARKSLLGAETEANKLEAGRMATLDKLEGQHAMNVANRQLAINEAVQQQKNARVFADVARDIETERDRLKEKLLKKAGDSDFLGKLSMAGPEYRDAHDALFAAVFTGPEPQPQHGALEGLLARMHNEAQPIAFDVGAIRDLLADPKQWDDLTPPEARNFADAVANIRETAQRMNQIALSDRLVSKRELIAQIGEETSTRRDMGAPPLTRSAMSLGEKVLRQVGLYNASNLKPETIFQRLGETGQKLYEDTIIKGRNYKAELQGDLLRHFQEDFDKPMQSLRKELSKPAESSLTVPKEVDLDDSRINGDTLAMAFLNLGTLSNEQTFLGGYKWDKQQVLDDIGKNLKPETVRLLQGILAYHDEKVWPLIREKAAKSGVTPPHIVAQPITITFADGTTETFAGGYFPRAPHPDALNVPTRGGDGIQNLNQFAQASVQASFTKTRVEGAEYPVDLNWSRYPAHLNAVFHYLAYDEPVRDLGRLLRDDEFRSIVRHRVGDQYLDQLDDDLKVWARGNAGDSSRTISLPSRMLASVLRTRTVSNALAMSTPIALGQESHVQYAITSGQISAKNGTIAMGRALVPEVWRESYTQSKELQFRADHYAAQFREALGGPGARSDIRRSIDVVAFAQMDMADRVLSHVVWDAAYNDALGQDLAHEDAVTQADRKLRLLMPTHNVMEMAPIVRDRGTIGALMLFRGLPNVVWNVEASLYDEAHQQMAAAVGPKMIAAAGGRAALNGARAVASIAVLHAMGRLLMGHGKTDEDGPGIEGWATWAEREAVSSQFSRLPFGRDIVEPYVNAFFHDKTMSQGTYDLIHGAHAAPDIAAIHSILRDLGTAFDEGKDTPDRVQAGINSLALLGGVGARPITRAGRYLYDLQTGARSARGPFDFAGGVVYGERDKQAKNPGTAIQDVVSGEQ